MYSKKNLLGLFIITILIFGCAPEYNESVEWDLNPERTMVSGVLTCDGCKEADIEILVTDENTGLYEIILATIYPGVQFSKNFTIESDWLSVDLQITAIR